MYTQACIDFARVTIVTHDPILEFCISISKNFLEVMEIILHLSLSVPGNQHLQGTFRRTY